MNDHRDYLRGRYQLDRLRRLEVLEERYEEISRIILARQHPVTGLLPASTAVNAHGDYTDAWVRDNVYSVLAVWGLGLAYRRVDTGTARVHELEQSVVKLMRGLMFCMMRQAHKVERFKHSTNPIDALHAKFDTGTGQEVVGDEDWGHLQLDATSLYLLMLAQMTASGLKIVFNRDEADFIQNLVWYISRAYCTPDYGIWERGNKINHGLRELNASSIGMALAALEAMDDFDVYGGAGDETTRIRVLADDIARTEMTLKSILPRESGSKEVDAALLSVVGFPAFAMRNPERIVEVERNIVEKLEGRFGCKRFLRDGHQTVLEDPSKLHYEPEELERFEHIESEWPLFFTYLLLNRLFAGDEAGAIGYREKLEKLFVHRDGLRLLPELYYVPESAIEQEKAEPGSCERMPNENQPLVWAQSLFTLGALIQDGLLEPEDLDPLARHRAIGRRVERPLSVAVLAESRAVQSRLEDAGIRVETLEEIQPIEVHPSSALVETLAQLGDNPRLGLEGRPRRRVRGLTTARVYEHEGRILLFRPQLTDTDDFYLSQDTEFLIAQLRSKFRYIHRYWRRPGRPLLTLVVTERMLREPGRRALIAFLRDELFAGESGGIPVQHDRVSLLVSQANIQKLSVPLVVRPSLASFVDLSHLDRIDICSTRPLTLEELNQIEALNDEALLIELDETRNLYRRLEILSQLVQRLGLDYEFQPPQEGQPRRTLEGCLTRVFLMAQRDQIWGVMRRAADLLGKVDAHLEISLMDLIVRQKRLAVGRSYSGRAVITEPLSNVEIVERIRAFCGQDERERIFNQELIVHLGSLMRANPNLFHNIITLRVGPLLQTLIAMMARERRCGPSEAFDLLIDQPPHEISERLQVALSTGSEEGRRVAVEALHLAERPAMLDTVRFSAGNDPQLDTDQTRDWLAWRTREGAVGRLSDSFYASVWSLLRHCPALVIGDRYNRKNVLESQLYLAQSTAGEMNFALEVEHRLNRIVAPEYRQLVIECLGALFRLFETNPELKFEDPLILDVIIGHAVRLAWFDRQGNPAAYNEQRDLAWAAFYQLPPHAAAQCFVDAIEYLLHQGEDEDINLSELEAQP
ncbi:MAG: glycoside hydrolase family 15 protein [Halothiobacillaceae bacterium]